MDSNEKIYTPRAMIAIAEGRFAYLLQGLIHCAENNRVEGNDYYWMLETIIDMLHDFGYLDNMQYYNLDEQLSNLWDKVPLR